MARMGEKRNSYRVLDRKSELPLFEHDRGAEICVCVCFVDGRIKVFTELLNTEQTNSQLVEQSS